jgi:hypothetical protein
VNFTVIGIAAGPSASSSDDSVPVMSKRLQG